MASLLATLKDRVRRRLLRRWIVVDVPDAQGCLSLTFDDGPHPVHTREVLDVLDRHGAKATFFCVGENLRRHPGIAGEILERGHELSNHSMTHAEFASIGARAIARELDGVAAMTTSDGRPLVTPGMFRSPKGVINLGVLRYCASRASRNIYWSRDPEDFATRGAQEVIDGFGDRPLKSGDIVLLHDKLPHSAEAVELILRRMSAQGLRSVTVGSLLASGRSAA